MPFITDNRFLLPNKLITNTSLKPFSYRGFIDLNILNNILKDIVELIPTDKDVIVNNFNLGWQESQIESDTKSIDSIPDSFKFFSSLYIQYEMAHIEAIKMYLNLVTSQEIDLPMPYFTDFIPAIEIKQLNNNPYSDLDPLDDPKIKWKITVKQLVRRHWYHFWSKGMASFSFID